MGALHAGPSHWLLDTLQFHQMAAATAISPDWTTDAVLVALGAAAAGAGAVAFRHRDLVSEEGRGPLAAARPGVRVPLLRPSAGPGQPTSPHGGRLASYRSKPGIIR